MYNFHVLHSLWKLLTVNFLLNTVIGSFMLFLPWVALDQGGDWRLAAAALPMLLTPIGYMFGAFEAGRHGDLKHPKSLIIFGSSVALTICIALSLVTLTGARGMYLLIPFFIGALCISAVTPFIDAAVATTISKSDDIVSAAAWRGSATQSGSFGGPAFTLVAYGLWGIQGAAWTLSALSLLALLLAFKINIKGYDGSVHTAPLKRSTGYSLIRKDPLLWRICLISALWNTFAILGFAVIPILMSEYSNLSSLSGGVITFAGIIAAMSSPFLIGFLRSHIEVSKIIAFTMLIEAVLVLAFGFLPNVAIGFIAYALFMLLNSACSSSQTGLRTLYTNPDYRASIDIAFRMYSRLAAIVGSLIVLLLVEIVGPLVLALVGLVAICGLACSLLSLQPRLTKASAELNENKTRS